MGMGGRIRVLRKRKVGLKLYTLGDDQYFIVVYYFIFFLFYLVLKLDLFQKLKK